MRPERNPIRIAQAATRIGANVGGWRRGELTDSTTYMTMRHLHRLTGGASSRVALSALTALPGSPDRAASPIPIPTEWCPALAELREQGLATLPDLLDAGAVSRIREFALTAPANLRFSNRPTEVGTYASRDADATTAFIVEDFILRNADVQSILASEELVAFAADYLGAQPVFHPPQMYWSCVTDEPPSAAAAKAAAQTYHWDYDGLAALRLHMYLTDVDLDSAPMGYLRGSHRHSIRRRGLFRGHALRHGDLGVDDDDVWSVFSPDDSINVVGAAGTTFISDSQGLHRGNRPRTGDRLFFVMPIQAGSFSSYQLAPRRVTPRDPLFAAALAEGSPHLRLFDAGS